MSPLIAHSAVRSASMRSANSDVAGPATRRFRHLSQSGPPAGTGIASTVAAERTLLCGGVKESQDVGNLLLRRNRCGYACAASGTSNCPDPVG